MQRLIPCLMAMPFVVLACSDKPTLTGPAATSPNQQVVKFWDDNAAVYWNGIARGLVARFPTSFPAIRGLALVTVAQYNAAVTAEKTGKGKSQASAHAAISAASVVALTYLFPGDAAALESRLDEHLAADGWPGDRNRDAALGEAVGRDVAAQIIVRAEGDRLFAPWTGTVPIGPGFWFSATPPAGAMLGQAKTYFLTSGSQFRPPPPPAFGSSEFLAALAEVRQIADTRTPEQDAIAKFWAVRGVPYWNEVATTLAVKNHRSERETAHLLALMNMVAFDGLVASHEAKYFYWLLRPIMADPGIRMAIAMPNFPAYPSNHAVLSAGIATILGESFPAERDWLDAQAVEAAISRIYGGIHFRFDADAGLVLGRTVAAWALAHDVNGHEPFVLQ